MTRRSFFARTFGAIAVAAIAPLVKFVTPAKPIALGISRGLTYKGIPMVFDRDCPTNVAYFINCTYPQFSRRFTSIDISDHIGSDLLK